MCQAWGWSRWGSGWDPRAGPGGWERGGSISPVPPCVNQTYDLGWKTPFLPKAILLSGHSAASSLQINACLHGPVSLGSPAAECSDSPQFANFMP